VREMVDAWARKQVARQIMCGLVGCRVTLIVVGGSAFQGAPQL